MYQIDASKKPSTPGVLRGCEMGELTEALKAEDMKRRVEEADQRKIYAMTARISHVSQLRQLIS